MDNRFKRVCVIGLGYVGLPTAAILAKNGIDVVGVDIDSKRVEAVNSGCVSFIEPELDVLVREAVAAVCKRLQNPVVACLGLAYKADTDDLRNSPAIEVIQRVRSSTTGRILVVEPYITDLPPQLSEKEGLELTDLETALNSAQVILPLTDHTEFLNIDIERLRGKEIVDARGIWQGA